ncbi:MAG: 1-acyl-sn-glycerol-3-phosphate acyltransferase [Alphaproteobacteria bacterium]|nr:1-acyl-sn-glycerol-3-phosphate acyltransferase [Alphaproteobacteria bacterium]
MIWLRSFIFNALFMTITALAAIIAMVLLPFQPRVMRCFIRYWARLIIWVLRLVCGIRVEVTGLEHIAPGAAIIASKHQSAFDTFVWPALLDHPSYVLKRELLNLPFWGRAARHTGAVVVDRDGGGAALRALVRDGKRVLDEGRPLVIFPEGTRSAPGEKVPYQPGVAALVIGSGAPCYPVATNSGQHWGRRAFHKMPGVIAIAILPPLPAGLARKPSMEALETQIEAETARLIKNA